MGPCECGRFVLDADTGTGTAADAAPAVEAVWNRAWNGDEWCGWIIAQSLALIAEPDDD